MSKKVYWIATNHVDTITEVCFLLGSVHSFFLDIAAKKGIKSLLL